MEFKHSPAPWHFRDGINENSLLVDDNYNVIFASLDDIKKEDADLIAAAPELLEALIEMQRNGRKQGWNDAYESSMEKTRLAISKALGQQ
ncbi:hypothetical protein [Providencia rettgeri]|uniref:Uncharacterized protein n=1 Tax=Providencia rettgeri TaxID=587 RepID=A0AAE2ZJ09_PRORE|nr:hypothetical protein [Providencia rettgeri]MBW3119073.1 hypothetical protein [Providencia rettgeri]NHN54128.1 hypothetical protein [Providencia rettgeri]